MTCGSTCNNIVQNQKSKWKTGALQTQTSNRNLKAPHNRVVITNACAQDGENVLKWICGALMNKVKKW